MGESRVAARETRAISNIRSECRIGAHQAPHSAERQSAAPRGAFAQSPHFVSHPNKLYRIARLGNNEVNRTRDNPEVLVRP